MKSQEPQQHERVQNHPEQRRDVRQQLEDSREYQRAALASRDANLKNATVNIAQILKDFRGDC